jgi:superfamily II DNA or RNA helicase
MTDDRHRDDAAHVRERLKALDAERAALTAKLAEIERAPAPSLPSVVAAGAPPVGPVTATSPTAAKVALFRQLFAGRLDLFPVRWENSRTGKAGYAPACAHEWVKGVCGKPEIKCGACPNQAFIPVSDDIIERHLRGVDPDRSPNSDYVAGVYPLLPDDSCWFLAADFDKASWAADALAMLESCRAKAIPAALERSRSGNGGHVWIFFSAPLPARIARQLGAALLTDAMERRPEIGFGSYDRFFPSQDTMPSGGFGNLIALPLQRRARQSGNSVFVNEDLRPHADQWAFLSALDRLSPDAAGQTVAEAETSGRVLGVRMPVDDEDSEQPWRMTPSRRSIPAPIVSSANLPARLTIVIADQVYVERTGLPPTLIARLIRLAAFQNPEFYRAQAMRFSTFGKPRIISCAELHPQHVGLPRGCLDTIVELLNGHGIAINVEDQRVTGTALAEDLRFQGTLRELQVAAVDALTPHDIGVLAATTAFGKTVIAAALIAHRACNALILVHRRELLKQWVERLKTFLNVPPEAIGVIGGGRRKPTGIIDVALMQSLVRHGEVSDAVADYGHLIVDECHHVSAASFELVTRRSKARFVLGLSATVTRKDGHHPIIFMQCGPVRYRAHAREQAAASGIAHRARMRSTGFWQPPGLVTAERAPIASLYAALAQDEGRNDMIFDDVLTALEAGRSPILLTERRDHLEYLRARFARFVRHLVVLRGGMSAADRNASDAAYEASAGQERLVLATGRYIGEGFDDPRLDTLFLTLPISWRGTLAQYVGRLHRRHDGKTDVLVVDYVDDRVPLLAQMAAKRRTGYRALGYRIE